jgi:hypothetical protein
VAKQVPLNELAAAVQSAVAHTLAQHGQVPINQIWVGFIAPDALANMESAGKVASELGKGAHGQVQASMVQLPAAHAAEPAALVGRPGHIVGLVFNPNQ